MEQVSRVRRVSIQGLKLVSFLDASRPGSSGRHPGKALSGGVLHLMSYAEAVVFGLFILPLKVSVEEGPRPLSATSAVACGLST